MVRSNSVSGLNILPCNSDNNYLIRSECTKALANMIDVTTALGAYYSDTETYPDTIDKLNTNYLPK